MVLPPDSANYTSAGKGFFKDKQGNLYILTEDVNDFDTTFVFYKKLDSIDLETFSYQDENNYYAKDKNHVFVFQPDACGTNVFILSEADPQTFEALNYRWGRDKNFVYENAIILDSLNAKNFWLINMEKDDPFFDYAYDGKFAYYDYSLLDKPDSVIRFFNKHKSDTAFCKHYKY